MSLILIASALPFISKAIGNSDSRSSFKSEELLLCPTKQLVRKRNEQTDANLSINNDRCLRFSFESQYNVIYKKDEMICTADVNKLPYWCCFK